MVKGGTEEDPRAGNGDPLLQQLNRCRGMMLRPESWPAIVHDFASQWNQYKVENGLRDFCDLIDKSLRDVASAPGHPAVLVVDEAQDLNRMQLTLIRRWSEQAQYLVLAGDDDQTIYAWAGAAPDAILDPEIPEDHKVFLKDSIRVPRTVHVITERLIHQVSRRQEKTYRPRPADGEFQRLSMAGYRSPEYWILKTAERHIQQGKSIMFLTSCSYMLHPLIAVLRKNGIPFHNPHRKSNGFWNPLRIGSRKSAANRLLALVASHPGFGEGHRKWRFSDLALWTEWLRRDEILLPGAMEAISANPPLQKVSREFLETLFVPDALNKLHAALGQNPLALLHWWGTHVASEFRKRIKFPTEIAVLRGTQTLG